MPPNGIVTPKTIIDFTTKKTWSEPMTTNESINDYIVNYLPSILLEKNTGRVYVLYKKLQKVDISVLCTLYKRI